MIENTIIDSTVAVKRRSFIPKSIRPDIVGTRVAIVNAQSGLNFYNEFVNLDISPLKNFAVRKKLLAQIFNFSENFFEDKTKILVKILQDVSV